MEELHHCFQILFLQMVPSSMLLLGHFHFDWEKTPHVSFGSTTTCQGGNFWKPDLQLPAERLVFLFNDIAGILKF
jgi:hypothetical protein